MPEKKAFTVIGALTVDLEKETTPGLQPSIKNRLSLLEPLLAFLSVISNNGGDVKLDFLKNMPLSKLDKWKIIMGMHILEDPIMGVL